MFVNQLSPGDQMALKGKIFELQKKLNLLDVEQQNKEDFSFHPEITQYKLPNRKDDFINNLNQAEETRKDKFELLKKQLVVERSQDCSFTPQINNRKKDQIQRRNQKPVHLRLTEKGKEYQDSAEKRKEMVKSHDFDGNELFKPASAQKTRVAKGNMQVEEYLFRDAKDRVEKMDIKREHEKKVVQRIASKQKMNKHSALLVKRKCEREAREIFDSILSIIPVTSTADSEEVPVSNPKITLSHVQKLTISMLKFYEQHKGSLSFHNSVSNATSPYEVTEKIWNIIDVEENDEVNLRHFLSLSIPVLVAGGNADVVVMKNLAQDSGAMSSSESSYFYQFLSATHYYINKQKKQEKENESTNPKDKKPLRKQTYPSSKSIMSTSSINASQDVSVAETEDARSQGQTELTDDISTSSSLRSYNEKAALSRRIQSYNKVLSDREIQTHNRLEMLRESIIQKEMEECTFQPTISATAQRLREKEMLDESSTGTGPAGAMKVYDRLYAEKDFIPRSIAMDKHEPSADQRDGLDECTFVPKVKHTSYAAFNHDPDATSTSISNDEESVEDGQKGRRRKSRMEENMDNFFGDLEIDSGNQHIFKPVSPTPSSVNKNSNKKEASAKTKHPVTTPRGYADSIKRIREAALNKKKKEADEEAYFAVNEERYNKGLQQMAEGPKPFRFRTEERHTEKEKMYAEVMQAQGLDVSVNKSLDDDGESTDLRSSMGLPADALDSIRGKTKKTKSGELKPIRLYVEVKLGAAKKTHIAVADFDIPATLARDFCKIYGLDPGAEEVLAQVVENNMHSNEIPIGSVDGNNVLQVNTRSPNNRRSFTDNSRNTFSSNNYDDDDYSFYDHTSPQDSSTPLYDHAF